MQFILYCLCGGMGVLTDYTAYYLLVTDGVWYQVANIAGYLAGTIVSFFLNRMVTFYVLDKVMKRLAAFVGVAFLGYVTSALLLWLLVDSLHIDSRWAKLLTLPVVAVLQYSLNRSITFATGKAGQAGSAT